MVAKAIVVLAMVMAVNAGVGPIVYSNPSIGAQSELTVRGPGGFATVSKQSKAVDSPFSSVRKYDSRITNDAVAVGAPAVYGARFASPLAYQPQPAYATRVAPVSYSAPPLGYAAPVTRLAPAPVTYSAPVARVAAPIAYSAPAAVAHHNALAGKSTTGSLLGVAYSAVSPAVATLTFNGFGVNYGY